MLLFPLLVILTACGGAPAGPRFAAVYFDMDGTLLDPQHEVRGETLAALQEYRACGGRVGLATGRTREQVERYLAAIRPTLPIVLFNGGVIVDPVSGAVLSQTAVPMPVAERVWRARQVNGVKGALFQTLTGTIADDDSPDLRRFLADVHISVLGTCSDLATCQALSASGQAVKLMLVADGASADAVATELQARAGPDVRVFTGGRGAYTSIEVVPADINKLAAIQKILPSVGLRPEQIVVFGDGENDLEMLRDLPVTVAMANCHPRTCPAALLRAGPNDSDTIAQVLRRLVMGPGCRQDAQGGGG